MKTISYDPSAYKLVPVESSEKMIRTMTDGFIAVNGDNHSEFERGYQAMLAAVPEADQLPGVVVHSGEPVAWATNDGFVFYGYEEPGRIYEALTPLFANPAPSQPSAEQQAVCPACFGRGERDIAHGETAPCTRCAGTGIIHAQPKAPSAEALVQAALEAAALWIDDCEEAGETISFSTVSASIRALDKQAIIESCKGEKS